VEHSDGVVVPVAVWVAVAVALGLGVRVGVGLEPVLEVALALGVSEGVGLGDVPARSVGVGVADTLAEGVRVAEACAVGVRVGEAPVVGPAVGVADGDGGTDVPDAVATGRVTSVGVSMGESTVICETTVDTTAVGMSVSVESASGVPSTTPTMVLVSEEMAFEVQALMSMMINSPKPAWIARLAPVANCRELFDVR